MRPTLAAAFVALSSVALAQQGASPSSVAAPAPAPDVAISMAEARQTAIELAQKLDDNYVFPDVAKRYAAMLRANVQSGAYDGFTSGRALAERLTSDLRAVSADAHLRVGLRRPRPALQPASASTAPQKQPFPFKPIEDERWLAPGIAYIRFNIFPGDPETVADVTRFMKDHATAKVVIFDNRTHHGGGLDEMNAMFPYLFGKPATLVTMDTRASIDDGKDDPGLRKVAGPPGIVRREHFVLPSATERRLFDAKVFVLTSGATGSAAEHMTLALKHTHRATIIGEATAGAGHYGGLEPINEKFAVFIPVGRSFDPDTGKDWEGTGVAPDVDVPPAAALTEALVRSGLSRADAERINATVKPTGSMERRIPRRVAASN